MTSSINLIFHPNVTSSIQEDLMNNIQRNNIWKIKEIINNEKNIKILKELNLTFDFIHYASQYILSFLYDKGLFSIKDPLKLLIEVMHTDNIDKNNIMNWLLTFYPIQQKLNVINMSFFSTTKNRILVINMLESIKYEQKRFQKIFDEVLLSLMIEICKDIVDQENNLNLLNGLYKKYKKRIDIKKLFALAFINRNLFLNSFFIEKKLVTIKCVKDFLYEEKRLFLNNTQLIFFQNFNIPLLENNYILLINYINKPVRNKHKVQNFFKEYILANALEKIDDIIKKISIQVDTNDIYFKDLLQLQLLNNLNKDLLYRDENINKNKI